jgi:hypothetical protein
LDCVSDVVSSAKDFVGDAASAVSDAAVAVGKTVYGKARSYVGQTTWKGWMARGATAVLAGAVSGAVCAAGIISVVGAIAACGAALALAGAANGIVWEHTSRKADRNVPCAATAGACKGVLGVSLPYQSAVDRLIVWGLKRVGGQLCG